MAPEVERQKRLQPLSKQLPQALEIFGTAILVMTNSARIRLSHAQAKYTPLDSDICLSSANLVSNSVHAILLSSYHLSRRLQLPWKSVPDTLV